MRSALQGASLCVQRRPSSTCVHPCLYVACTLKRAACGLGALPCDQSSGLGPPLLWFQRAVPLSVDSDALPCESM